MKQILVTGTLGFDYIMDFHGRFAERIMPDKIHCLSLSFLVDTLKKQFGGVAGNIAFTLRLLGMDPHIVSAAGKDFGDYAAFFRKYGVDTKGIRRFQDVGTGSYFVVTDEDDNQIGSFYMGAGKYNKILSIGAFLKKNHLKNPFVVISANDPEAMRNYVQECTEARCPYLYDPSFQIGCMGKAELLKGISGAAILIGNDYEIALIEKKIGKTHKELTRIVPMVITTLAGKGSIIETDKKRFVIKPANVKTVVDPTGAGDAYRAGFLAGYLRGFDPNICGQMGSVAASYTVERYGTQTHKFTIEEFITRYKANYSAMIPGINST